LTKWSSSKVRGQRGFTLVETLVALALAALIASFLSGGLVFGRRAWEKSSYRDELIEIESARRALKDAFQRAIPVRPEENSPTVLFAGTSSEVRFALLRDPSTEIGGLGISHLQVVNSRGVGGDLVYSTKPLQVARITDPREGSDRTDILFRGIRRLSLRYFGKTENLWVTEWQNKSMLPQLVRIEIEFNDRTLRPLVLVVDLRRVQ
jgi:general secretion pathway protein J